MEKVKKLPSNWIDASFGGVRIYHAKDLAIYVCENHVEVHDLNIPLSKESFLLKSDHWENVISFVEERAA
jgi:hypothetical protein